MIIRENGTMEINGKDLNKIDGIEAITYDELSELPITEQMEIKGHKVFFIDFKGYFGKSVLVFKNGKHIYYADDFELHRRHIVKEENGEQKLRQWYIDTLNHKLYTEEELLSQVKSYDDYKAKDYYLRNYWIQQFESLSIFGNFNDENFKKEYLKKKKKYLYDCRTCFCNVKEKWIVDRAKEIEMHLYRSYKKLSEDDEVFREMISYELANHEACITMDPTDALMSCGLSWNKLTDSQKRIVKTELNKQINAYCDAD